MFLHFEIKNPSYCCLALACRFLLPTSPNSIHRACCLVIDFNLTANVGSEIVYFKNGVCQGTAFEDIPGGRYYPAASMYSLPDEPNCEVRFNFGPDFTFFPEDFAGRPVPRPMSEVPYQAYELKNEGPAENGNAEKAG